MSMKLFVWQRPDVAYYDGASLFAVAETVEEARALASNAKMHDLYGDALPTPRLIIPLGEPTRIVDVPCAEFISWLE